MEQIEREIDLLDMMETLCKKWRTMLVFMVIGLVIGAIVSLSMAVYYKNGASEEAVKKSAAKALAEAEEELDKQEKADELKESADKSVISYGTKKMLYEMQEEYMEESIYYNLDEENVCKSVLSYYIDNHYEATYPVVANYNNIEDIANYYVTDIRSNKVNDKIVAEVYPDSKAKYISELVLASVPSTGSVSIEIVADSKENSEKIASIIKDEIDAITPEVSNIYGDVDCEILIEQFKQESDAAVAENHMKQAQSLMDMYKDLQNVQKGMSGAQLEYFEAKLAVKNLENPDRQAKVLPFSNYVSKKMIAIAGILGIFIAAAIYACAYIFSGTLKTKSDLGLVTGSVHLGSVESDKEIGKNIIDRLINTIFHGKQVVPSLDARVEVLSQNLIEILKAKEVSKLCLVSSVKLTEDSSVNVLVNEIKNHVDVVVADDFLNNAKAVKCVNEADAVVVCEALNCSGFANVEQEMRLIRLNKANVVGCITE